MNKDKIAGQWDKTKGDVKQGVGDLTGDEKLKGEGAADKIAGGARKVVGEIKEGAKDVKDFVKGAKDEADKKI